MFRSYGTTVRLSKKKQRQSRDSWISLALTKVKARWGASSFTRLQPRIVVNHKYLEEAEPQQVPEQQISCKCFIEMLSPTFSSTMTREDLYSVFVRSAIIEEYPVSAMSYPLGSGRCLIDDTPSS
eukprot:2368573-Amphidinium_carterae.1